MQMVVYSIDEHNHTQIHTYLPTNILTYLPIYIRTYIYSVVYWYNVNQLN